MAHGKSYDDEMPEEGKRDALDEFDCPTCSAHNPTGDPLKEGQEIHCHYCGAEFRVSVTDRGKLKLKAL